MDWPRLADDLKQSIFPPGTRSQGGKAEADWIDAIHRVHRAASQYASLVESCDECDGKGQVSDWEAISQVLRTCPACRGVGVNPAAQVVEEIAKELNEHTNQFKESWKMSLPLADKMARRMLGLEP